MGNLLFAQRLTQAVSTDRVLTQFCHSSVAVSLTGNLPEDRHLASQNTFYDPRLRQFEVWRAPVICCGCSTPNWSSLNGNYDRQTRYKWSARRGKAKRRTWASHLGRL